MDYYGIGGEVRTKKEAAIISAFTGIMVGEFKDFHEYVENLFGYSIFTHQFADKSFAEKIKELSRPDFMKLCEEIK